MNENLILFCLHYDENNNKNDILKNYKSMLFYALETLYSKLNSKLDVIIFYDANIEEFSKFEKVTFIENKYNIDDKFKKLFYKWNCLDILFEKYNYEKVLLLDIDVIFYEDPIFIFEKYNNKNVFYGCLENSHVEVKKIIKNQNSINAGQILISRKIYNKIKKIHDNLLIEKEKINKKAKNVFDDFHYNWIMNDLVDQYALNNLLIDRKIKKIIFNKKDVGFGTNASILKFEEDKLKIESRTKLLHYFSAFSYLFLPEELLSKEMIEKRKEKIKKQNKEYWI